VATGVLNFRDVFQYITKFRNFGLIDFTTFPDFSFTWHGWISTVGSKQAAGEVCFFTLIAFEGQAVAAATLPNAQPERLPYNQIADLIAFVQQLRPAVLRRFLLRFRVAILGRAMALALRKASKPGTERLASTRNSSR
jgi:hypothetical protein